MKGAALLQLVYPADLAGRGVCVRGCACLGVSLCYRGRERGGDMLCSLCVSGGQEWTVLLLARFYPRGCARAVNGIEMVAHMSVCEGLCLFITCKMDKAHDTHSNYPGVISQRFIQIQPIKAPRRKWLETKCPTSSDNLSGVC